jgi:hypothetical protein
MQWWSISVIGILVGGAIGYAYRLPSYPDRYQSSLVQGLGCGIAGIVFWMIWRWGTSAIEGASRADGSAERRGTLR